MGGLTSFPRAGSGPVVVVEPAPQWARAARAAGWRVQRSALPARPWNQPDTLVVSGPDHPPATAVLALTRGAGVVLAGGEPCAAVLTDARRLGAAVWPGDQQEPEALGLDPDTARLLDALARGWQVGAAARSAHMSLRTAHRRLRRARDALGAATTAEAVGRWAHAHAERRAARAAPAGSPR